MGRKPMGSNGQGTSNGGGGGTTRASAANGTVNLSQMQALAQKSGAAADQQLTDMLKEAISSKVKVDSNQQDTDTQRFINSTGIADKKPVVVRSEKALENYKFLGETFGEYLYHTDAPEGSVRDAKVFGDQYMTGRMYNSSGVHGDGAYFANSSESSWSYGYSANKAYQIKGMLNSNAKMITQPDLEKKMKDFRKSHPKAYMLVKNMSTGYGDTTGSLSVYAQLFGYNVIKYDLGWRGRSYYTICDRSATTVVQNGIHEQDRIRTDWQYQ